MKLIKTVLLIIILLSPYILSANQLRNLQQKPKTDANITGHVIEKNTREHLPFINIVIKGTTIGTATDATGHYYLKNLPVGGLTIVASSIGFKTKEIQITTIHDKLIEVNFELETEAFNMDEVIVSASRNETNKKTSASVVNVISEKQFEATAASNLTETMNFQSGLRVENSCSNCGSTQLRINGLEGQYSQILLDSRPIFSSLVGVYGLEQLPVSMVERIEVLRGGGSALFGASAIGGVVNIITKEPLRNSITLSNNTNLISGRKTDVNTSLNGSFVSDDHKKGVYIFGMVRDRQPYDHNNDGFSEIPTIRSETLGFRGYYKTSNYSKLTLEYHRINEFRRGGDMFERPPHEANIAERLCHKINGGGMHFDFYSPNFKHRASIYSSIQSVKRDSYFGTQQNPDAYGETEDATFVSGGQYIYSFERLIFSPSDFTIGAEYSYNNLTDKIVGYGRDMRQTAKIGGILLQNEWKDKKYNFIVGARIDKHNLMKNIIFNPRINIRYSPTEKIGLRISYSSGYRPPQAYDEDLHIDAVGGEVSIIQLEPGLKPEYSHSFSTSADLYHNFGKLQTNLLVEGFYTVLNNVFSLVKIGEDENNNILLQRRNQKGATVKGMSFEVKLGLPGVVEVQLGYTIQQSLYKEDFTWSDNPNLKPQRKMFRSPSQYGYLMTNLIFSKKIKASVFGNYTGAMLVQHNAGYIDEDIEVNTPHFFDMGLKLSYNFSLSAHTNLEINGGVKNIFNQFQKDIDKGVLKDAGYVYGPTLPRTYFVGIKFYL
jgi:outer membrane receptor for ferrienterochelin and colicins